MTVLKRSSDKCTAQQDSTRARPHRAAAVTNLVKEDISHGIFRALEAGAVSWRAAPGRWALLIGLLLSPWGSVW